MPRFAPLPAVQPRSAASIAPSSRFAALRRSIGLGQSNLTLGLPRVDGLTDGFVRGALHEIVGERGAVAGFLAALLGRDRRQSNILWVTSGTGLHAPALAQLGLDHRRLTVITTPRASDRCRTAEEALAGSLGYGAVVAEIEQADPDMTQRLQDAAEQRGGIGFLVRPDRGDDSAAVTRWSVEAAHSDGARPCWRIALEIPRGEKPVDAWLIEWDHAAGSFRLVA